MGCRLRNASCAAVLFSLLGQICRSGQKNFCTLVFGCHMQKKLLNINIPREAEKNWGQFALKQALLRGTLFVVSKDLLNIVLNT
jgi:hypothetical protein